MKTASVELKLTPLLAPLSPRYELAGSLTKIDSCEGRVPRDLIPLVFLHIKVK